MFEVSFEATLAEWERELTTLERVALPDAIEQALNWTAYDLRDENRALMPTIFDRPTRYTLNSLMVDRAEAGKPVARLWFKDQAGRSQHYLVPQVEGGGRRHKRFERWLINRGIMLPSEFAVPGKGARLDAYGNISAGVITQILSQLGASPDAHQWETARSRKRAKGRARYFVPEPGSRLPRGVWAELGNRRTPILIFVRAPAYQPRYHFFEFNAQRAELLFPERFDRALSRAVVRG